MYRTKQQQEERDYRNALAVYTAKKEAIEKETEVIRKELLMLLFQKMKAPTLPDGYQNKIERLETEISQLRKEDERKKHKAGKDAGQEPLRFSGSWERLTIKLEIIIQLNKFNWNYTIVFECKRIMHHNQKIISLL